MYQALRRNWANWKSRRVLAPVAAGLAAGIGLCNAGALASAAPKPTVAQALELAPLQSNVDYDRPQAAEIEKCEIQSQAGEAGGGWIVVGPNGRVLRRFSDTNRDNRVDQWCYYKDGIEVYRDIDQNFNGKADQYRWLGTLGSRWGLDNDEDGQIDSWKSISAEEVTAEVVAAVRDGDLARFRAVLISDDEIGSLGVGAEQAKQLTEKSAGAAAGFVAACRSQKVLGKNAQWLHFGGTQPGVIPEGASGSTKDLLVYENVAAIVDNGGKHAQLSIGALVKVQDGWRVIDLPTNLAEGAGDAAPQGFFLNTALSSRPEQTAEPANTGLSEASQRLMTEYERLERSLNNAKTAQEQNRIHARRMEIIQELAQASTNPEERLNWWRQLADTLSASAQAGGSADALARLGQLHQKLSASPEDKLAAAHAKFCYLTAAYTRDSQDPKADYEKVQNQWLADLEAFVKESPDSEDAAEAMLQLAIAKEFAGQEDDAKTWYGKIVSDYSEHPLSKKAAGAKRRLESVGQTIQLRGTTVDNKRLDLAAYQGRMVLVHYWATWCEPCKKDMAKIKELQAKYSKQGFSPIGVSLDADAAAVKQFLAANRLPWPHVYEAGGLESRLATEMGILTLPTMILIDDKGKVVSRNLHVGELETELGKRYK